MSEMVCSARGVAKKFGSRQVLGGLDLDVEIGEVVAFKGASGSGKSTLLNILGLLEAPDGGSVELFGDAAPRIGSARATKLRRHRIGYLFQNFALIDNETVDANLKVAQTYAGGSRSDRLRARADVLERVGLGGAQRRMVLELSGGEQQRVALARLLLKPRELVLADEPTGSLDPRNRDAVLGLLRQAADAGAAVIIVTHDDVVSAACDRLFHISAVDADRSERPQGIPASASSM